LNTAHAGMRRRVCVEAVSDDGVGWAGLASLVFALMSARRARKVSMVVTCPLRVATWRADNPSCGVGKRRWGGQRLIWRFRAAKIGARDRYEREIELNSGGGRRKVPYASGTGCLGAKSACLILMGADCSVVMWLVQGAEGACAGVWWAGERGRTTLGLQLELRAGHWATRLGHGTGTQSALCQAGGTGQGLWRGRGGIYLGLGMDVGALLHQVLHHGQMVVHRRKVQRIQPLRAGRGSINVSVTKGRGERTWAPKCIFLTAHSTKEQNNRMGAAGSATAGGLWKHQR
jgi:hypothetical protein